MAKGDYLGKWHAWKYIDHLGKERIAYTMSADPKPGDAVDLAGEVDKNGEYWGWNSWNLQVTTSEEGLIVNYNKPNKITGETGNSILIEYVAGSASGSSDQISYDIPQIVSYTRDFVPDSTGATYVFKFVDGTTQEMVVGETYDNETFNGGWSGSYSSDQCTAVKPENNCYTYVTKRGQNLVIDDVQCI